MSLSGKHRRTLKAVFARPVQSNIRWHDIERLIVALGGEICEGRGSRLRVHLNGVRAVFHRPHPQPDTDKGAVSSVRRFLNEAGIRPEE
ncbi:MAG: type II toxin-antitoxin system HicA family toxin [Xanthomonadales bacterium]|nr:type II toxin-antitoxin system HicA family toxin [Xanthomonadales bacterium]